ncbi:ZIP family metal transporter [Paenibacillus chartarius]|uniref:ZIP family metal transporter n=1 Tax=Paenibacillus chartarius TaxID=747481 RepID=A0ABV6DRI7_9BACL
MTTMLLGSILSALSTGLGALPILVIRKFSHRARDMLLAFAAGIMVAASTYGLIPQALKESNLIVLTVGVLLGTLMLTLLESTIPHQDVPHTVGDVQIDRHALLVIVAITLHNLPEGLSVGVSYASSEQNLGALVAVAIGLQNAPEGLLVALFLVTQNIRSWTAFLIAAATGAVEIVTALLGYYLTSFFSGLVPYGLAFAAGSMLFIVYKELIPESHGHGHERPATFTFIIGLLLMIAMTEWFR